MRKSVWKDLARKRIRALFAQAAHMYPIDPSLANRYVYLARKLAMRFKVRIPRTLKRRFCKHCYTFLVPSKNARVRVQGKKVVIFCQSCKKYTRIPIQKRSS